MNHDGELPHVEDDHSLPGPALALAALFGATALLGFIAIAAGFLVSALT